MRRYLTALLSVFALLMGYEAWGHGVHWNCPAGSNGYELTVDDTDFCMYSNEGDADKGFVLRTVRVIVGNHGPNCKIGIQGVCPRCRVYKRNPRRHR